MNILNRMVTAYLEIAELQALNQTPMYMKDWIDRLDDFLKLTGKEILNHAGSISHEKALDKANKGYQKYQHQQIGELTRVEEDFIKQIETTAKKLKGKK